MRSWASADIYRPIKRNILFYDGPSRINGEPIIVVASAQNGNRKIGRMLQLWIMLRDISPIEAVKTGLDVAICGDCKLRGSGGQERVCYVEYFRAVENIWQSSKKPDRTERMTADAFAERARGIQLRFAAYGDPVAVPMAAWDPLLAVAGGYTAYTHQWMKPELAAGYKSWCMASADTDAEHRDALAQGWRTFRMRAPDGRVHDSEVVCPHEVDAEIKCADCSLCRGAKRPAKSIVATVHGAAGRKHFPLVLHRKERAREGALV